MKVGSMWKVFKCITLNLKSVLKQNSHLDILSQWQQSILTSNKHSRLCFLDQTMFFGTSGSDDNICMTLNTIAIFVNIWFF